MTTNTAQMLAELQRMMGVVSAFQPQITVRQLSPDELPSIPVGRVTSIADGVATVFSENIAVVGFETLVTFESGESGLVLALEGHEIKVVLLSNSRGVIPGMEVFTRGQIASVPVGEALIGRVVNALGQPIDGKGRIETSKSRPIERIAPGIYLRKGVDTPVQTGIKSIDTIIPIGRGQRELIIGDRQTGKTALTIDTIINQKGKDLICIYCAIGQKDSTVAAVIDTLERYGAMEHTIVVVAGAGESAALQYIAPYAACAMGEEIMESGKDALVVYDDLTKHAWAYCQVSSILRRPPGREAYPGDVFYLHSRLLERAAKLHPDYGGGSLTALPIIETQLGDVSAYIPTNVISITDGQIYLENELFMAGIRPAINIGLSVSRVGSAAQIKAMKQVSGGLRLSMAQFRELYGFTLMGADLDKATQALLDRGLRLQEVLKQFQYEPMSVEHQVVVVYGATHGYADKVDVIKIKDWELELLKYMQKKYPRVLQKISDEKRLSPELDAELNEALKGFEFQG